MAGLELPAGEAEQERVLEDPTAQRDHADPGARPLTLGDVADDVGHRGMKAGGHGARAGAAAEVGHERAEDG